MPSRLTPAFAGVLVAGAIAAGAAAAWGDDCRLGWRVGDVPGRAVVCRDGEGCDADGAADGRCTTMVRLCADPPGCAAPGAVTTSVTGRGAPAELPVTLAVPALAGGCTPPETVGVALEGRHRRRATLRARVAPAARQRSRPARLHLVCRVAGKRPARAVVVTTDFETGLLATVRVTPPRRVERPPTRIDADAVVRVAGERVFVLNRLGGDNVQVLDPARGFATALQCSTGARSNPHDIAVVAPDKAYVTRYGAQDLWIVDPGAISCGRFRRGHVDLAPFADGDGVPEMDQMAVVGRRLFVTLQRLDQAREFRPTRESLVVVIDTATDAVEAVIPLRGTNPFGDAAGLPLDPMTGKLLVAQVGDIFRVGDGGIQRVDPVTLEAEPEFFVTEDALGGNVTDFVIASPAKGYAIVFVPGNPPRNLLVAFDPATGAPLGRLLTRPVLLPDIALAPDGTLWLADRTRPRPGIRIFDVATDRPLTRQAIDVGLRPFAIGFLP